MGFKKLNYDQYQNWRRACRLNYSDREPATFADLRSLYLRIKGGSTYGQYSGYSP